MFDTFAIKTYHVSDRKIVGHLPTDIFFPLKFFLERGTDVGAQLSSSYYRKSPLYHSGLEIPYFVRITLATSTRSDLLMCSCKDLVEELHAES